VHPYLLRHLELTRSNHVWAGDLTSMPMKRGVVCLYLFAVLDWASRQVWSWCLPNTLTTGCCLDAVQEAMTRDGAPDTFNTDHDDQFPSQEYMGLLKSHHIAINVDGIDCWRDHVFVERFWRSVTYEAV
jgi:putative transposase